MIGAAEREERIRCLMPLTRKLARRLKRLVPNFDVDDLIGDGCVGLIRAVDSFDSARGPRLDEYARRLIVGSMLNGIRRMDPVSERARRIVRDGENERYTIAAARGDVPSAEEMDRRCPGYRRAIAAAYRGQPLSLDAPLPLGESLEGDWANDPGSHRCRPCRTREPRGAHFRASRRVNARSCCCITSAENRCEPSVDSSQSRRNAPRSCTPARSPG